MTTGNSTSRLSVLPILYGAFASGVLLYAAVVLLFVGPFDAEVSTGLLRAVWLGVAVLATLGAGVARGRLRGGEWSESRGVSTAVFVWGLVEGQALVGLTAYMLTGDRLLAIMSLALFAYLYLRYPPGAFRARLRG